jgi:cytochrome P450
VYRLYFHPLSRFPGPKFAAASIVWHLLYYSFNDTDALQLWYVLHWTSGNWPHTLAKLHRKYGDVVRTGPNELSFASAESWKDIYGHAGKGRRSFLKSNFYDINGKDPSVFSARDQHEHSTQRKALSAAFSAKALREQEDVIHHYVDLFIAQIGKLGDSTSKGINIIEAFNWLTFDIIGDLTFGESFDAVKSGKTHPWVSVVVGTIYWRSILELRKQVPLLNLLLPFIVRGNLAKKFAMHMQLTKDKIDKRVQQRDTSTREDFFKTILSKGDWSEGKLESNAEILIVAGSETTATALSGIVYYLSKNPDCMVQLQKEVAGAFTSYDNIKGNSAAKLPYLNAVIEEGLRLYPPVAFGLPRVSPGAIVSGHYVPTGTLVSTQSWASKHDPRYWHHPDAFLPERWIGDGFGDRKEAFNPFLLGPRACLGINLAYLELRVILAKMVWAYEWEMVDKHVDWVRDNKMYVIWEKPQMKMRFRSRMETKV